MPTTCPVQIRQANATEAEWLQEQYARIGWSKPDGYFAECCRLQDAGRLSLLLAIEEGDYRGHCKVVWQPNNPYFKENQIPEIQDLNVLGEHRRRGIATALMDEAERLIGECSQRAGIAFGLYADYGAAQRMYILRGYVPDGCGVSYRDVYVEPGRCYRVDDALCLGLVKYLGQT